MGLQVLSFYWFTCQDSSDHVPHHKSLIKRHDLLWDQFMLTNDTLDQAMSCVSNKHEGTVVFSGVLQWTGRVNNLNRNPVVHLHGFQQNTQTWIPKIRLCYFHKCFREHKCAHTWSQLSMAAMSRPTVWVWLTASGYSCWAIDIQSTTTTLASLSRCITAETSLVIQLSNIPLIWERERKKKREPFILSARLL